MLNDEINHKAVKDRRVDTLSKYSCQNTLLQSTLTSTNCETTMTYVPSTSTKDSDEKLCNKKESVNPIDEYDRITNGNIGKCQENKNSNSKPADEMLILHSMVMDFPII